MEGWFPLTRGERIGWNVVLLRITKSPEKHLTLLIGPTGRASTADAGCQTWYSQRDGEMCLDSLPHGRKINHPFPSTRLTIVPRPTPAGQSTPRIQASCGQIGD